MASNRLVILAPFLPVLAGQSGNTGCRASPSRCAA
jgi:Mg/Co/Ni transporter MgtE